MARPKKLVMEDVRPVIEKLVKAKASKVEIAEKLNISRNTLHYWINKYPEIRELFEQ